MKNSIKRQVIYTIGSLICLLVFVTPATSQSLQTITDKKDILIGEQLKLKVKAIIPQPGTGLTNWLVVPDSIPHFEVIERSKIDSTTYRDDSKTFEQTLTITSFDSGRWAFPSLRMAFAGEPDKILLTDSFIVQVSFAPPDSTNQLRDIKPIIGVEVNNYFWYYVIGGALLLLLLVYLLYRYLKKRKPVSSLTAKSKLSPFDEAMEALKKLSQYNLEDVNELKSFHAGLAHIFKNYLGRKTGNDILNETTGDLLISVKRKGMQPDDISKLATALRCTDAVKFAKYRPSPDESRTCLQIIQETIQLNEQQH